MEKTKPKKKNRVDDKRNRKMKYLLQDASQSSGMMSIEDSTASECVSSTGLLCNAASFAELEDASRFYNGVEAALITERPVRGMNGMNQGCTFSCVKPSNVQSTTIYEDKILNTQPESRSITGSLEESPPSLVPIMSTESSSSSSSGPSSASASSSMSGNRSQSNESSSSESSSSSSSSSSSDLSSYIPSVASSESTSSFSVTEITHKYSSAGKSVVGCDGTVSVKDPILKRIQKSSRENALLDILNVEDDDSSALSVIEITRKYSTAGKSAARGDASSNDKSILSRYKKSSALKNRTIQFDDGECSRTLSLFTQSSDEEEEDGDGYVGQQVNVTAETIPEDDEEEENGNSTGSSSDTMNVNGTKASARGQIGNKKKSNSKKGKERKTPRLSIKKRFAGMLSKNKTSIKDET